MFKKNGFKNKLIENLESFIIAGAFKNEYIPENILKQFLQDYYQKNQSDKSSMRNLERIIS